MKMRKNAGREVHIDERMNTATGHEYTEAISVFQKRERLRKPLRYKKALTES